MKLIIIKIKLIIIKIKLIKLLKIIFSFHCVSFHCRSPWGGSWADGRSTESFPLSLWTIACRHCHLLQVLTVVPSHLQDVTCFCCKTQIRDLCICWITRFKIGTFFLTLGLGLGCLLRVYLSFYYYFIYFFFDRAIARLHYLAEDSVQVNFFSSH